MKDFENEIKIAKKVLSNAGHHAQSKESKNHTSKAYKKRNRNTELPLNG